MKTPMAHVKEENGKWYEHSLEEHLLDVADLAKTFMGTESATWLDIAGRWHDLGKYQENWQHYLKSKSGYNPDAHIESAATRVHHSTAGAIHSVKELGDGFGHIIAYLIAGHHAGLGDWEASETGRGALKYRLESSESEYIDSLKMLPSFEILKKPDQLDLPDYTKDCLSLWIRMMFSSLVDADFLDTEDFFDSEKSKQRSQFPSLATIYNRYNTEYSKLIAGADSSELNKIRKDIYQSCLNASKLEPGIFSLTVPTGGGKTLSSLAFALEHAKIHNKDRIIYGIPFTSIIEQNAKVFRAYVGDDAVLEHHSNIEVIESKEDRYSRLAAENWDAPLIVTTNVQLFESLHASKTSRCRKLHNLRNSIIILDEAQQLPRDFHAPITHVMQQLSDHFGVTWVLCTATQPDFSPQKDSFGKTLLEGLSNVREIVSNPTELAQNLKRVEVELPSMDTPKIPWKELAHTLSKLDSVLAIVNTRRQAKSLFDYLPTDDGNFCLTANMCAEHRTEVIQEIKDRLKLKREGDKRPLRVVSTQLIEAGVDVDFPIVYRAIAGLDSIAQSAGRCNREGKLANLGKVIVFKAEEASPIGFLRQGENATIELIASGKLQDPLSPESLMSYFSLMNEKGERDKHDILGLLRPKMSEDSPLDISFRSAAEKFKLIDNNGVAVIVPYKKAGEDISPVHDWLDSLRREPLRSKWVYRKLQRYSITLPQNLTDRMDQQGYFEYVEGLLVLVDSYYISDKWGFHSPDDLLPPEKLMF